MEKTTYSIIIPHKNTPKLLQRCLDSIPQRDDLEVIVVDDNSDSRIVDFDNFPGKDRQDTTIIFDKSGKGAGRARNIGLEHAKGKWLLFADADDFFTYCFNDILNQYKDDISDIIFLNACSIREGTYLNANRCAYKNHMIDGYLDKDPNKYELLLRYDDGAPWSKMIKRSLTDKYKIVFDETSIHNDARFSYMTGHYAEKIKVDRRAIYCVTYSPTSISFTLTDEKYLTRMHVIGKRDQFVQSIGLKLDCTSKFLQRTLLEIQDAGKKELFEDCLQILEEYGFSANMMRRKVNCMLKRQKRENMFARGKSFIKRIFNYSNK